jgi:thymidylate kinase
MTAAESTREEMAAAFPADALPLTREVFGALNAAGVRYCHWKSTTALALGLAGQTDLDLLVDRDDAGAFSTIVRGAGFKPFISHPSRRYVGVEDWLGHDRPSGRLVHLHVYYRLVLGEDYVKNHVLPIEKAVLDDVVMRNGVKVPAPATELVILVVRALLKYRRTDAAKDALRLGHRGGIALNLRREVADLSDRASSDELRAAAARLVPTVPPEIFTDFVEVLRTNPRDAAALLRLRAAMRRALRGFERLPARRALAVSLGARLQRAPGLRRVLRPQSKADLRRKSSAAGGLTVAVIGPDGAGKSTVIEEVVRWLGWRLSLRTAYLGTARPSPSTAVVQTMSRYARRADRRRLAGDGRASTPLGQAARLLAAVRYLAEARDRVSRAREGRRLAANGTLVLFDRYPLPWVRLANRPVDGPRIAELHDGRSGGLLGLLQRREEAVYAAMPAPDLVILLSIEPEVALARKGDQDRTTIVAKARAVQEAARGAPRDGVVVVDASQPLDAVVSQVEAAIWQRL